jgi:hypothetical protein
MNEREAVEEGYHFTGVYVSNKEEAKAKAKEMRVDGNKAVVVTVPPSKYSRGYHGDGYSVYLKETEENRAVRLEKEKIKRQKIQAEGIAYIFAKALKEAETGEEIMDNPFIPTKSFFDLRAKICQFIESIRT